jgi:hypothetical protein
MGDRINPVAVKELRQAVQSQLVIAILMLFLIINLSAVGGYLLLAPNADTSADGGQTVFNTLLSFLLLTCISFVPLYTGVRMTLERSDANIDLLFITTITPSAIVRGKYVAALALTLLIFSICMPFMTLTYLLRGIDLPTIFLVLAGGFLVCAIANAAGIFVGCISGGWFTRISLAVLTMIGLLWAAGFSIMAAVSVISFGSGISSFATLEFWAGFGTWVLVDILAIGLFHVYSVAMLSPTSSNRMFMPRIFIMICWVIVGVLCFAWAWCTSEFEIINIWTFLSCVAFISLTMFIMGERDAWSLRIRRTIPKNSLFRLLAFLFYTGSGGGLLWCILMFTLTMLIGVSLSSLIPMKSVSGRFEEQCWNLLQVMGYALCYCMTIAFLRLTIFKNTPTRTLSVLTTFLAAAAYMLPSLAAFLLNEDWWSVAPWFWIGSPMVLSSNNDDAKYVATLFLIGWLILGGIASIPWLIGQWRRFTPFASTSYPPQEQQP